MRKTIWATGPFATASAAAMALSVSACSSLSDGARAQFSRTLNCPLERVTVTTQLGRTLAQKPPAEEIRVDPARMAEWQTHSATVARKTAERTYYVVRGCDQEVEYYCVQDDRGALCSATDPHFPDWDLLDLDATGYRLPH